MRSTWWRGAVLCLLACLELGWPGRASAAPAVLDVGTAPIIFAQSRTGSITIRTWDRPQVRIETDGALDWQKIPPERMQQRVPPQITLWAQTLRTPDGAVTLPVETFVVPELSNGPHEGVLIKGDGNTTITVPTSSAAVIARMGKGTIAIDGYHQGFFVAIARAGSVRLSNVSGTGAIQIVNGSVIATNSDFTRLRARTARGNLLFANCNAQQIQVSSVLGSIAYDNGAFAPGLARFDTQRGNVAVGVASGGVQFGAHTTSGHVFAELPQGSNLRQQSNDTQATLNGGGPLVTATSASGSVYLYNGSFRQHPQFAQRAPFLRRQTNAAPRLPHPRMQRQIFPRPRRTHRPPG